LVWQDYESAIWPGQKQVVDVVRKTAIVYSVNTLAQEAALACIGMIRSSSRPPAAW
jgi:hypothetical protein